MDVLVGADFFTVEVLTWRGLVTYYVLFFLEVESRRVWISGIHATSRGDRPRLRLRSKAREQDGPTLAEDRMADAEEAVLV